MAGRRVGRMLLKTSMHVPSQQRFRFVDFHSYPDLTADPVLMDQLVDAYQRIFGDPDGWAEEYSPEDVRQKLQTELAGQARLRVCLDEEARIAGFCWAQVLDIGGIVDAIETIKYYRSIGSPDVAVPLRERFGARRVIYLHDLGIDPGSRGRIPLTQLIYPVLDSLAERSGIGTVLFWSVADTNVSRLAKRALFHRILALEEMRFYSGDIGASRTRPGGFGS